MTNLVSDIVDVKQIVCRTRTSRPSGLLAGESDDAEPGHTGVGREHMTQVVVGIADDVVDHRLIRVYVLVVVGERIAVFVRARSFLRDHWAVAAGVALVHQILVVSDELQPGGDLGYVDP